MKTKFFTLFAAMMLLFGAKAAAVEPEPETKYYWYVGQTQPTADNYTTLEGIQQVTDYPTTFEYTNNSGKRGYAYVILHNSKTLTAVEKVSQATVNFTTDTSIPNYTIYKSTAGMAINGVMVITVNEKQTEDTKYYWYVGTTMPDAVDPSTWEVSSTDAGFTATVELADGDNYLVIPNDWVYTAIEPSTNLPFEWSSWVKPADKVKIPGYTIKKAGNMVATEVEVTFSKAEGYYWYSGSMMQYGVDVNSWGCSTTDAEFTADMTIYEGNNYLIIPDSWDYTMVESSTGLPFDWKSFIIEEDKTTISGYVIVKVSDMTSGYVRITFTKKEENPTPETTYYWYLGTEKLLTDADVEAKGSKISSASEITNPFTIPTEEFVYFYYPKSFGKATLTCSGLPAAGKDVVELTGVSLTNYNGWRFPKGGEGAIININFTDPEYTVSLNHTNVTLTVGESVTLIATITPEGATTEDMWWTVYDTNIATVEDGVVTALAEGSTRIIVHVGDYVAACQVTVEAAAVEPEPEPTPITAISELSNAKLYHVSQPNHSKGATAWAVAEDGKRMKSNVDLGIEVNAEDNSQLFAFVSNDGGQTHYLYHAAEKKFVSRDGALFDRPIDAIQFKAGASEATFVAYFGDGRYVNVGGSQQLAIDGWSDADGGNSCVILPAGAFDATEALAMFSYEEEAAPITTLDALSNHKAYYVKQPQRGTGTSWAVQIDGAALKSNADLGITASVWDYRQHFAFLTNNEGGTYYLYHVTEAKFVAKDGSLSTQPVDAICFTEGKFENTFVVCFDNEHYINVGGGSQMVINGWSTPDEGNSCELIPAADFDATEALKLIDALETGIEETTVNGGQTTVIYDLLGRRVENPTKGIYIVGGRKVIVK